jgi:molybdate transport system permease protein
VKPTLPGRPRWWWHGPLAITAAVATGLAIGVATGVWVAPSVVAAARWLASDRSRPFWLSARITALSTVIAATAGGAAGYVLAKGRFAGRDLLEALGSVPMILAPTVLGYYLLQLLGNGASGRALTHVLGGRLLFSTTACVIAASIAAFPFCLRASRAAIEGVDPEVEAAARSMGLPEWKVALRITLPVARRGMATGVTLGALRALGEYGTTLMVGGDIPGTTRTMALAVTEAPTTADRQALLAVLVVTAFGGVAALGRLGRSGL